MSYISSIWACVRANLFFGLTACHQIVTRCSDGCLTHALFLPQGCMDKHRVMGILRQMEKFLKGQEIRFTEGLRIMKSKLTNLQNSLSKLPQADQSPCKCHNTWHIHTSRYMWSFFFPKDLLFPHRAGVCDVIQASGAAGVTLLDSRAL